MRFPSVLVPLALAASAAGAQQPPKQPPQRSDSTARREAARIRAEPRARAGADDSVTLVMPHALTARSIGPAVMGGRVSAIAIDPTSSHVYYVGLGTGGIMKTTDGGDSFEPVFEHQPVAAIGAIAVAPSNPQVVWVGTGEANDRNSVLWGNGVYRSDDGGATWKHVGLDGSRTVARIAVHPTDPNTAWACATGDLWRPNAERGLFRTTDGGATWKKVLGAAAPYDTRVGCGDVAVDPKEPNTLYAALYARERRPWTFLYGPLATDGKDLGGIFRSTDGGEHWTKLTNGLPTMTGRIGLSVYAKNPKIVYAIVQSDEGGQTDLEEVRSRRGGVFRSDDGGTTWTRMSALNPRPFYFSQIRVDPANDQRVYVLGFALHVSEDGGRSWREDRSKNVHPDLHALVVDPLDPTHLVLGTDGGAYQSRTRGAAWTHLAKFAAGEFYRIALDTLTPYRVCGGLQDNTNWIGPTATRSKEGIRNGDWTALGGGDGSYCAIDPQNPSYVYAESQQGWLFRFDLASGATRNLHPVATEGLPAFRFQWTSPLVQSVHDTGVMYYAGDRVFRLTNHGEDWRLISPDLSTRDYAKMMAGGSGAEDYGTVYALAESPVKAGQLWAGTDDGKLWKTDDEGAHWTDLTANLPAAARGLWVARIAPSHHDASVAYLALSGYRSGNYAPLVYRTADGGRSWQSVAGNLPANGPVEVVAEDARNPRLLFAGTEFGLYATLDGGRHWFAFGGLPTVSVVDLAYQPRERDLVVATHGRSLYVVDDIGALQDFTPAVRREAAHLFAPRPAYGFEPIAGWVDWAGSAIYRGQNPPMGALIDFWVRDFSTDPVRIAITDSAGVPVANLTAPATPGLDRVVWDLKPTKDLLNDYGGEGQRFVRPGEYTVTLTHAGVKQSRTLRVTIAPGIETR